MKDLVLNKLFKIVVPALMAAVCVRANAAPMDGQVVSGSGVISKNGNVTNIEQTSRDLLVNWKSFNIAPTETVNFKQPDASSIAVNRITDTNGTQIFGQLNANGQVYLINPNGILFGKGAQVNVGGLVASTLENINNTGSTITFSGIGNGSVINEATLNGQYIALISNVVSNSGTIVTNQGTVALGAGSSVSLTFSDNNLVNMQVDSGVLNSLVENGGAIKATGGHVILSAGAKDELLASVVNNTGIIQAQTVENHNGTITLLAGTSSGTVNVGGTLDVSASDGGHGGKIIVTANRTTINSGAKLDASGKNGGGVINVGGSLGGADTSVAQSTKTTVQQGAVLDASATSTGDGGTVVVWSNISDPNSATHAHGSLLAKGGANSGNGGTIETSGYWLDVLGTSVDTTAPMGSAGLWLLDPYNITIGSSASGDAYTPPNYAPSTTDSTILASTIATALNGGNNVTIATGSSGASAGNITVASNIAKTAGGTATLTLQAANDIIVNSNIGISSSSGALNVLFNSATSGSSGAIVLNTGSSIVTNGGDVTFGGGANPATGYAFANGGNTSGISVSGSITTGAGNVTMHGKSGLGDGIAFNGGTLSSNGTVSINGITTKTGTSNSGVSFTGSGTRLSTATGTVTVNGSVGTPTVGSGSYAFGVYINGPTLETTGTGTLTFNGTTTANVTPWNVGLGVLSGTIRSTASGGGALNFTGDAVGDTSILLRDTNGAISISSNGGNINFIGKSASYKGFDLGGNTSINAGSGNVSITTDKIIFSAGSRITSTGAVTVKPYTSNTTIGIAGGAGTLALPSSYLSTNIVNGFSSMLIGNSSAGTITVGGATTLNDSTSLISGGNIAINGALTSTGNMLTLTGGSGATVSGSGNIIASSLLLNGSGATYTLNTATGNSVGTLAANSGALAFYNNAALAIGTVGSTNGITSSGTVDVETLSGNLTVSQNISSTNTGTSAIVLNAARNTAVGTSTGGDVILSGSPTISTGTGGRAIIYTGSVAGSTGLTTLVGSGTGNFRYNSNVGTTNFTTALGSSGKYAVYREQPVLKVAAASQSMTYGNATPSFTASYSSYVNGDSSPGTVTGTASWTASGTKSTSNNFIVGTHNVSYNSGLSSSLGYAFTDNTAITNELTVNKKDLSGSITNSSSTYGAALSAGTLSFSGVVGADQVTAGSVSVNTSGNTSTSGNLKAGSYTGIQSIAMSGTDIGNYNYTTLTGDYTVNKRAMTVSATGANKVYDGLTTAVVSLADNRISSDVLTLTNTANFTDKNVATGKTVNVSGINATGTDAGNYTFNTTATTAADITPATLSYIATTASIFIGDTPSGLTGTVSGFVTGETQASVTTGTLSWSTTASSTSSAGQYSIDGSGLSATSNYVFAQDASNATALTVKSRRPPVQVQNVTTSNIAAIAGYSVIQNPSTTISSISDQALQPVSNTDDTSSASVESSPKSIEVNNTTMSIAGAGILRIVNAGMRLPIDRLDFSDDSNSERDLNQ